MTPCSGTSGSNFPFSRIALIDSNVRLRCPSPADYSVLLPNSFRFPGPISAADGGIYILYNWLFHYSSKYL